MKILIIFVLLSTQVALSQTNLFSTKLLNTSKIESKYSKSLHSGFFTNNDPKHFFLDAGLSAGIKGWGFSAGLNWYLFKGVLNGFGVTGSLISNYGSQNEPGATYSEEVFSWWNKTGIQESPLTGFAIGARVMLFNRFIFEAGSGNFHKKRWQLYTSTASGLQFFNNLPETSETEPYYKLLITVPENRFYLSFSVNKIEKFSIGFGYKLLLKVIN